jgi:hypothetical protein
LYYIDYSETTDSLYPKIHKILASIGAFFPSISNDGNIIAYNTGNEGQANVSTWLCSFNENTIPVCVRNGNAHEPRFSKGPGATLLLYTTTWQSGDWDNGGQTLARVLFGFDFTTSDTIIYKNGSFHCGLSYNNRYLATTQFEPNPRIVDLKTNNVFTLHSLSCKNKTTNVDTIINPQCCNGSISSSRIFTNVMMYMDFGLPIRYVHPILGTWGFHQRIFIVNTNGEFLKWFDFPDSLYPSNRDNINACCWTYCEWAVNHPYFAVASNLTSRYFVVDSNYTITNYCEDIYGINLKSGSYIKLIESTDNSLKTNTHLQWPYIWIEVPQNFMKTQHGFYPMLKV